MTTVTLTIDFKFKKNQKVFTLAPPREEWPAIYKQSIVNRECHYVEGKAPTNFYTLRREGRSDLATSLISEEDIYPTVEAARKALTETISII
jgi:hypothetical protein